MVVLCLLSLEMGMKMDEACFCFCFDGMTSQKVGSKQFNLLVPMHAVNMSAIQLLASHCIWLSSLSRRT